MLTRGCRISPRRRGSREEGGEVGRRGGPSARPSVVIIAFGVGRLFFGAGVGAGNEIPRRLAPSHSVSVDAPKLS